jgi:dolichyl-diphosphooligosaccharide--protein glycosyltransferase
MIKVKVDHILLWDSIYGIQDVAANPDADYYLKLARDLMEQPFSFKSIAETNLLSLAIAITSKSSKIKDLIWAGNILTPICCGLTFVAIGLFFSIRSNLSPWGWATAFYSLLISYLCSRMGPGYIDTDLLNVFFIYLISALIYFQVNVHTLSHKYFLATLTGVLNFLFIRWYGHEGFTLLFSTAIIASHLYVKESWKNILAILGIFIFLSVLGGFHFFDSARDFLNSYITDDLGASAFLKSGMKVQELQVSGYNEWAHILFEWPYHWAYGLLLVVISLLGNVFWFFEDKKRIFACFIPFIFIPLSFFVGDRFYIYIIPLFWFGLFFIARIAIIKTRLNVHAAGLIAITLVSIVFFINYSPRCLFDKTCTSKVTLFRFPSSDVTNTAKFTGSHFEEENNTLIAWWDYGYYLALHTKFNLVLNNGNQFSQLTRKFVDAVLSEDPATTHQQLKKLNQYSYNTLGKERILNKIYVLINQDFVRMIPDFYQVSSIEKIKAHTSQPSMKFMFCNKKNAYEMICNQDVINYRNGLINQAPNFFKIIYLDHNGKLLKEKMFNLHGQDILVNFSSDKEIGQGNIIVPRWFADTTLMKLYLGEFDPKFFKLVYNHFPEARIYELN